VHYLVLAMVHDLRAVDDCHHEEQREGGKQHVGGSRT
jgi:hypothetical protein